jgi:hypothetical protein
MSFLKTLGLATLALFVALALNADPAMAKPKHKGNKHHNKHLKKHIKNHHQQDYDDDHHAKGYGKKHGHGHAKYNCDLPYGLRKQGKVPPGWAKKCGHRPHAHDRSNQDPGYHEPDRDHGHHAGNSSPCTNIKVSGKAKDIAVGTAMGSVLGGVIGSGTGDTETGAVFGGVVGGIIGATAGDGDKSKSSLPKC